MVKVDRMRVWPVYVGRLAQKMATQNYGKVKTGSAIHVLEREVGVILQ
jgi:hypothetical protein